MNTVWSEQIQSAECLYFSRNLRFADRFQGRYTSFFAIPDHARILEIGCGPGALCASLVRWYPKASVCGVDRDSNFITFAQEHVSAALFSEGDAAALSFADDSFDVTISNTVSEHIAPDAFFSEQYRVLKPGGVCLLLSARKGVQHFAPCVVEESTLEREIWLRVSARCDEIDRELGICAYPMTEQELPLAMEKYGFRNVAVEHITIHLTPDDPANDRETACAIIESERASSLNAVLSLRSKVPDLVTDGEVQSLVDCINKKYNTRLTLYKQGEKQWDTVVSHTMMVRGVK